MAKQNGDLDAAMGLLNLVLEQDPTNMEAIEELGLWASDLDSTPSVTTPSTPFEESTFDTSGMDTLHHQPICSTNIFFQSI